jgi:precorrin-6Y C5,15-methyltransferase (decarboxylating)
VIGVLDDGAASLDATALAHLRTADVVIGATRQLQTLAAEIRPEARN